MKYAVYGLAALEAAVLLDVGASPNLPSQYDRPVFFDALENPDILALLLRRGAHIEAMDDNGWTALMLATRDGLWLAVDLLLAAGADTGRTAPDGTDLAAVIGQAKHQAKLGHQPAPPELLALKARLLDRPISPQR